MHARSVVEAEVGSKRPASAPATVAASLGVDVVGLFLFMPQRSLRCKDSRRVVRISFLE